MKKYFEYRETSNNGFMICPIHEMFGTPYIEGSFIVFAARFMGVSWPDWLRLCVQNGASLYGKGMPYVHAVWKTPNKSFLEHLNKRTNEIADRIDLLALKY